MNDFGRKVGRKNQFSAIYSSLQKTDKALNYYV